MRPVEKNRETPTTSIVREWTASYPTLRIWKCRGTQTAFQLTEGFKIVDTVEFLDRCGKRRRHLNMNSRKTTSAFLDDLFSTCFAKANILWVILSFHCKIWNDHYIFPRKILFIFFCCHFLTWKRFGAKLKVPPGHSKKKRSLGRNMGHFVVWRAVHE